METITIGPPSVFTRPDYYASMFGLLVTVLGIVGVGIRHFIVNPLNSQAENTGEKLEKIDSEVTKVSDEVKSIRIAMESINSSAKSAHHRIDSVEHRVTRIEDVFFKNK